MNRNLTPKKSNVRYPNSIVDEEWEYLDPTPDIHVLFIQFNQRFFNGKLESVLVKWSPRMTLCAGLCRYEGRSGMCSISLSLPLLKLRPRKDLVETLLHEMIHAFLFVTKNNRDRDGHGPEFQSHMNRINQESGTKITIYHSFHDEVRLYKQHWWKCSGPCQHQKPFYGLVKRSMNRAPGPNDTWWAQHQATCGGSYTKIKEPENYGIKKKKSESTSSSQNPKKMKVDSPSSSQDIRGFFGSPSTSGTGSARPPFAAKTPPKSNGPSGSTKGKSLAGTTGMVANKGSGTFTIRKPATANNPASPSKPSDARPTQGGIVSKPVSSFVPFAGQGQVLGGSVKAKPVHIPSTSSQRGGSVKVKLVDTPSTFIRLGGTVKVKPVGTPSTSSQLGGNVKVKPVDKPSTSKIKVVETVNLDDSIENPQEKRVPCPVCQLPVAESKINQHLDTCLNLSCITELMSN